MVSITTAPNTSSSSANGMRPINLSTDLAPLADLIEVVFADTMDSGGRAALREMRMLSKLGRGVNLLQKLGDSTLGIQQGYVWIEDGKLIGNVSIYPAKTLDMGHMWIIANVGTHPDYRQRGIARDLMRASLDAIRARGAQSAVLQVDYDNHKAQNLYLDLGFRIERAWTVWRRSTSFRTPPPPEIDAVYITHPRSSEWRAIYALAQHVYPDSLGGLGWLRPLTPRYFHANLWQRIQDMFNLRSSEQLVIRSEDEHDIHAALLIERTAGLSTRLSLMVAPQYVTLYDEALISTAVRRFGSEPMVLEYPYEEQLTAAILERYHFRRSRTAYHMRIDFE